MKEFLTAKSKKSKKFLREINFFDFAVDSSYVDDVALSSWDVVYIIRANPWNPQTLFY